jgi:hypothetical protein
MPFKDRVETVQAIVTIIAIITGGIWSYNLFIKERSHYPHANIEQKVSHIPLSKDKNLLRIDIGLTNTGSTGLFLKNYIIRVQQILPLITCEENKPCIENELNTTLKETKRKADKFSWLLLYERDNSYKEPIEIEPDEKEMMDFEFVIHSRVKAVRVYSYFQNESKTNDNKTIGWDTSAIYDFRKLDKERDR